MRHVIACHAGDSWQADFIDALIVCATENRGICVPLLHFNGRQTKLGRIRVNGIHFKVYYFAEQGDDIVDGSWSAFVFKSNKAYDCLLSANMDCLQEVQAFHRAVEM